MLTKQIQIGSKVLVKDFSKTGISGNKLISKKRGPYTIIARSVNNNAYKVRHDRTGHTDYVGLRRIRLITSPTDSNDNSNSQSVSNPIQQPNSQPAI